MLKVWDRQDLLVKQWPNENDNEFMWPPLITLCQFTRQVFPHHCHIWVLLIPIHCCAKTLSTVHIFKYLFPEKRRKLQTKRFLHPGCAVRLLSRWDRKVTCIKSVFRTINFWSKLTRRHRTKKNDLIMFMLEKSCIQSCAMSSLSNTTSRSFASIACALVLSGFCCNFPGNDASKSQAQISDFIALFAAVWMRIDVSYQLPWSFVVYKRISLKVNHPKLWKLAINFRLTEEWAHGWSRSVSHT